MSLPTLLTLACALCSQAAGHEKPKALLALEQARQSLFSGTVRWTYVDDIRDPGREFNFVCRYAANGDRIFEERGDQEGWVTSGPDGKPNSKVPQLFMVNTEGVWHILESHIGAYWWKPVAEPGLEQLAPPAPDQEQVKDIRFIGIHPTPVRSFRHGTQCLWTLTPPQAGAPPVEAENVQWRETLREDGRYEVTGVFGGRTEFTWVIDPERGWNAEYMAGRDLKDDSLRIEMISTLTKFGEVWFPERVECLANGERYRAYTIEDASFNQPDDPVRFTGSDIGFEPGFQITGQNFAPGAKHPLYWDGDTAITFEEWKAGVAAGRFKLGPTVETFTRTHGMSSPYLTEEDRERYEQFHREMSFRAMQRKPVSLWEQYVADFIKRYALTDEQSEKAHQILRECQNRGTQYLDRRKSEFYKLQSEINNAVQAGNKGDLRELNKRLRSLRRPVEEIFEKQLKPRLEKLPTSAQRRAAQAKAATQPGKAASKDR